MDTEPTADVGSICEHRDGPVLVGARDMKRGSSRRGYWPLNRPESEYGQQPGLHFLLMGDGMS